MPVRPSPGYEFGRGYDEAETKKDYAGLYELLGETAAAFEAAGLVLTLAYYPDGRQEQLLAKAAHHVSLMHMMSYDAPGRHSTWDLAEKAAKQGARLLPAAKLTLGLPFYGRHITTGEQRCLPLHTTTTSCRPDAHLIMSGDWRSYEDLLKIPAVASRPTGDEVDQ